RRKDISLLQPYQLLAQSDLYACYLTEGFHQREEWGVWSAGRYARMMIVTDLPNFSEFEAHITLEVTVINEILESSPVLQIIVDDRIVGYVMFRKNLKKAQKVSFYCDISKTNFGIDFHLTYSDAPSNLGRSTDHRELGFGVMAFTAAFSPKGGGRADESALDVGFWGV
ncbi:MAG TPA: hypothetical protein VM260_12800, partial [Pirellula sp.]|nr:hypothetical protein [Pirellula sp.]